MLVPLQTTVTAPGFAALFADMMRRDPSDLLELASSGRVSALQMQPVDAPAE